MKDAKKNEHYFAFKQLIFVFFAVYLISANPIRIMSAFANPIVSLSYLRLRSILY